MRLNNSFRTDECSIPEDMTIADYRRSKAAAAARRRTWRDRAARARRPAKGEAALEMDERDTTENGW